MRKNILAFPFFVFLHETGHVIGFLLFGLPIRRVGVKIFSDDVILNIHVVTSGVFYSLPFYGKFLTLIGIPLLFQLIGMKVYKIDWRFIFIILFWFRTDLVLLLG